MKILILDIETSANVVDVWSLWNVNVGLNQIHEVTRMLCLAAKWHGEKKTMFFSEWTDGKEGMIQAVWDLLDQADAVVSYNGDRFDIQHLNREFVQAGMGPPSPFKSIDIVKSVKRRFRFPSNKLQYVSVAIGFEGKLQHSGHSLWTGVIKGDAKARKTMQRYNVQDVVLLEKVHDKLLPWLVSYPNVNLYQAEEGCPKCGSQKLQKRGTSVTLGRVYQRLHCTSCGAWSRSAGVLKSTTINGVQ